MKFPHLPVSDNTGITRNFEHLQGLLTKGIQRGTSLPGSPIDGQEYDYVADATNGVIWRFRYRAASASTHKWEFVGGAPLFSQAEGQASATSVAYVELAGGPEVTVPLGGDYEIVLRSNQFNSGSGGVPALNITTVKFGAAAAKDEDGTWTSYSGGGVWYSSARSMIRTGIAVSTLLKLYYRSDKGEGKWQERALLVRPIRVG